MKLPWTLSLYIGRQFLLAILLALLGLSVIVLLIDMLELIRRASGKEHVPFSILAWMTLFKLPGHTEKLLPFAVLIGSMLALTRLTRTHELIVARASGISVWQFLTPALGVALTLGALMVALFNPVSAVLLLRYEHLEGKYLTGRPSLLSVSSSGLWLRQIESNMPGISEHIIHASRILQNDMSFSNVIVFTFDGTQRFTERLDAERATLGEGELTLTAVTRSLPGQPAESLKTYRLPTTLTLANIQDSFASPETMSFWHLPAFINTLENAGFSGLRHRLYWQSLLALPFLLCGMVLVAAVFSLRQPRRGKIGILIVAGLMTGFSLHFVTDLIYALGAAGALPVALSAWTPATVALMVGAALLLHLEDG